MSASKSHQLTERTAREAIESLRAAVVRAKQDDGGGGGYASQIGLASLAAAIGRSAKLKTPSATPTELRPRPEWTLALEKQDIEKSRNIVGGDWCRFTLGTASWTPFAADPAIRVALARDPGGSAATAITWLHNAEEAIHRHILRALVEMDRAERYRALGRGWIFVLVRRDQRRFKWWFESIQRVVQNHQSDISRLKLTGDDMAKYTSYVYESEVVFCTKGLSRHKSGEGSDPTIAIVKLGRTVDGGGGGPGSDGLWNSWATTERVQKSLEEKMLTEEERRLQTARALKNRRRRERRKQNAKAALKAGPGETGASGGDDDDGEAASAPPALAPNSPAAAAAWPPPVRSPLPPDCYCYKEAWSALGFRRARQAPEADDMFTRMLQSMKDEGLQF